MAFKGTKPHQILFLIYVTKSTLLKRISHQHIAAALSSVHLPVCHSTFLPLSRLLFSEAPCSLLRSTICPFPPTFSHSRPLPSHSFFLSSHTAESLLIICDLLKYIHCHSLWLSLWLPSLSLPSSPSPRITHCLPHSPLCEHSVSFVFLFCRINCALTP